MSGVLTNWILLGLCCGLSFILSGMEAGVFALSRLRIRQAVRAGRSSARWLHKWLEQPENFLWTIFVGNTVVNFVALGMMFALLYFALVEHHVIAGLAFVAAVFVFYALFDLLPKMLFRSYPNRLCLAMARPFRFLHVGLWPLVALVEGGSTLFLRLFGGRVFKGQLFGNREEFRQMMQDSSQTFTSEERAMINRVLDLQSLTLQSISTPISVAVTVTAQTSARDVLALFRERSLTRLPVWDVRNSRRRIVGLIDVDRLIFRPEVEPDRPVGEFIQPAIYLSETLRVEEAMRRMRRAGQMLAIVMREDREVGLVSMQDMLTRVFGEVTL